MNKQNSLANDSERRRDFSLLLFLDFRLDVFGDVGKVFGEVFTHFA